MASGISGSGSVFKLGGSPNRIQSRSSLQSDSTLCQSYAGKDLPMSENCACLPHLCLAPSEASQILSSESGLRLCPCVPSHPNAWPGGGNHAKDILCARETPIGFALHVLLSAVLAQVAILSECPSNPLKIGFKVPQKFNS